MSSATDEEIAEAAAVKQGYYLEMLAASDIQAFPDALRLVQLGQSENLRLAAASSSRNAPLVLDKIGLLTAMDALVTGADIARGKPAPEIFLTAASRLELEPLECAVFEDAEVGIEAAHRGGFFAVGVNRGRSDGALAGADLLVDDLDGAHPAEIHRLMGRNR